MAWVREVRDAKPELDKLVSRLKQYGAVVESIEDSMDVAALHYKIVFAYPEGAVVTIGMILKDHQTDSDAVIETMTTLPEDQRGKGFGAMAIKSVLQWAKDNGLGEVRATQIRTENEKFWEKNEFKKAEDGNPCNDFVHKIFREESRQ